MDEAAFQALLKEQEEKIKKRMREENLTIMDIFNEAMDDLKDYMDTHPEEDDDDERYAHASKDEILTLDDDEILVALSQKVFRITEEIEEDEEILAALNPVQRTFYILDTFGDYCFDEAFGEFLITEPTLIPLVPEALSTIGAHNFETLYQSFFMSSGLDVNTFHIDLGDEELEDMSDRISEQYALYYFEDAFIQMDEQVSYHGLLSRYLRTHIDEMLESVED